MQSLEVISVNIWDILISLANLLIIFLLFKLFLYKPVRKVLDKRKETIDGQYSAAEEAKQSALADKQAYEIKLKSAEDAADSMIKSAAATADRRSAKIIDDAKEKADGIIRQAHSEVELERKKAADGIKREIADVSALLTEKMLEREINENDHREFIDSFIEGIGEDDVTGD